VLLEHAAKTPDVRLQVVLGHHFLTAGPADSHPAVLVGNQPFNGIREKIGVGRWHQETVGPGFDEFRDARHEGADTGDLHRHRFHQRNGDTLGEAGENEYVCDRQQAFQAVLID
jgi:hypothetical protein